MAVQADYISVVQQLYVSYFGRPADFYGLDNFTKQLAAIDTAGAYVDFKTLSAAANAAAPTSALGKLINSFNTAPEAIALYGTDTTIIGTSKFVAAVYKNILGRDADVEGLKFWVDAIQSGVLTRANAAAAITEGALSNTTPQGVQDALTVTNKNKVATAFTAAINETTEINGYSGDAAAAAARAMLVEVTNTTNVAAFQATVESTLVGIVQGVQQGTTFNLTKGVDSGKAFTGGIANDTFIGTIETTDPTFSALDAIDGGAGNDTLKINALIDVELPGGVTVSNIEKVEILAAGKAGTFNANGTGALDLSTAFAAVGEVTISKASEADVKVGSATAIKVVDVAGGVEIVGGASQTVTVATQVNAIALSGSKGAVAVTSGEQTGNITVDGGTTVAVTATATAANGDISVGDTVAATGAVTVTSKLNSDGSAMAGGDIYVEGGSTVNVTVNAVSTAKDETSAGALVAGDIEVLGNGKTTSVTVTQTATENLFEKAGTAVKKETSVVTFSSMKSGEALIINGLTFTAAKDLTAEQVAGAFANLGKVDTQSATGPVANGIYTGSFTGAGSVWTSGAASGKTVTFTANDEDETDLTFTGTAATNDAAARVPTQVKTAGTAAVAAVESTNTAAVGNVVIDDAVAAAITTVVVDGYATADIGQNQALDKLTSLSLANSGGAAAVQAAATTLDLTVNKVKHAVDLDDGSATVATLKVHATGTDSAFALTAAAVKDLTVDGTKAVNLTGSTLTALETVTVSGSAGLNLGTAVAAKSINTTATTGTVTATIDGNAATYTGGAGKDNVTLNNATVSKAITLGAGDDTLTLAATTTSLGVEVIGGDGTDTLVMNSADAAGATSTNVFETKVTGFEKLSLNATLSGATDVVDIANIDDINYVISKNSAISGAVNESAVVTFQALAAGQSVTIAGRTVTVAVGATATAADIAAAYLANASTATLTVSGAIANWAVAANAAGVLSFTSTTAATNVADITLVMSDAALAVPAVAIVNGVVTDGGAGAETTLWTSQGLTNGQAFTIAGVTVTAQRTLTAAEVAGAFTAGATSAGNFTVSGSLTVPLGWAVGTAFSNVGDQLTLTNGAAGNVTDVNVVATGNSAGTSPTDATAVITQGSAAGGANGSLTLKNFVANGTLELTAAGAGVTVNLADATGAADTLNIVTKVAATSLNFGTVAAAGVETIVLTATDTKLDNDDDGVDDAVNTSTIVLSDAALKTVTVKGNAAVDLQLNADVVALTTVDGSTMTGKLTHTTNSTVAETVTGGAAGDLLKANGSAAHKLIGGAGNDTLWTGTGLAQLTGGAGKDVFHVAVASTNVNSAASIMDLSSTDTITFATTATAFKSGAITLDSTAVFQDFANAAIASITANANLAWFQFGGNTYIVQEADNSTSANVFVNAEDSIVKIVGLVDLSTASFNATSGTLEIA